MDLLRNSTCGIAVAVHVFFLAAWYLLYSFHEMVSLLFFPILNDLHHIVVSLLLLVVGTLLASALLIITPGLLYSLKHVFTHLQSLVFCVTALAHTINPM